MSAAAWTFLAAGVTMLGSLIMFFVSRRHKEDVEDANVLSSQITAIGEAAVAIVNTSTNVTTFVQAQMEPLQRRMAEMQAELDELKRHNTVLDTRIGHVIDYVRLLRRQVRENGLEPHPPPDPLEGFTFD